MIRQDATLREVYDPAMKIETQEEADAYFEELMDWGMADGKFTRDHVEKVQRENLAYWAGYYDHATRARVEKLFQCRHPILPRASSD